MLYLFTIIILLFFVYKYDYQKEESGKESIYRAIFIWFALLSGLQYRMGADLYGYMGSYSQFDHTSLKYIFSFEDYQPGWKLLNKVCYSICHDFVFLKSVIAIFVNYSFSRFFRNRTVNIFCASLLYFLVLYFPLNYNILRESISISIFLLSFQYMEAKKYIRYFACAFIAFMFHESSLVLLLLPLFNLIRLDKKAFFTVSAFIFSLLVYFRITGDFVNRINFFTTQFVEGELLDKSMSYLNDQLYSEHNFNIIGLLFQVLNFLLILMVFYVGKFENSNSKSFCGIPLCLLFLFVCQTFFPIFYRFYQFLLPFYLVAISDYILNGKLLGKTSFLIKYISLIFLFTLFFLRPLFVISTYGERPIVQYYPYSSVFDKTICPEREQLWGYKEFQH